MPLDENYRLMPPEGDQPADGPDRMSQPVAGLLIAGYGCYVNAADIVKMEPVAVGVNHFVLGYLRGGPATGEASQRTTALLSPPLDSEEEAHRVCDRMARAWFLVLSSNPDTGGAHWPLPKPPVEERLGL